MELQVFTRNMLTLAFGDNLVSAGFIDDSDSLVVLDLTEVGVQAIQRLMEKHTVILKINFEDESKDENGTIQFVIRPDDYYYTAIVEVE